MGLKQGLHIGNYFGMMKPMIEYQEVDELYCFIVNYHAMTSVTDGRQLAKGTIDAAMDFLALGLDPATQQCHPGGASAQEPLL
jgi:tryptophanyl-tRNA synthetase